MTSVFGFLLQWMGRYFSSLDLLFFFLPLFFLPLFFLPLSQARGSEFGSSSWTEVVNCLPYLAADEKGKGQDCKRWIEALVKVSPTGVAATCKDPDRLLGRLNCTQSGGLCLTSDGARLWGCQLLEESLETKTIGSWTPLEDCTPQSLSRSDKGEACKGSPPKNQVICGDLDRAFGVKGGVCDEDGKTCRSSDLLRSWRCDLKPSKQGSWIEVRGCSADHLKGPKDYEGCRAYIKSLYKGRTPATCNREDRSQGLVPCDRRGKLCLDSGDYGRLFACH